MGEPHLHGTDQTVDASVPFNHQLHGQPNGHDTHSFYIDVHWITQHASVLAGPAWLNGARMEWVIYTLFVSTCYHVGN